MIDYSLLTKDIIFPVVRAIPRKPVSGWRKFFSFLISLREWEVMEDYYVWSKYLQQFLFIPKGFIYDGASVPKLLNNIYSSTGVLFFGSIIHDFGYKYAGYFIYNPDNTLTFIPNTKNGMDLIFNHLCVEENFMKTASKVALWALHIAGGHTWKAYRKIQKEITLVHDFPHLFEGLI